MVSIIAAEEGTQIIFAKHSGSTFNPASAKTDLETATSTDVEMDLSSVADGAAYGSAKFDFGAQRSMLYSVMAAIELGTGPTSGQTIDFYFAPSTITTAAQANVAGTDGAEGTAPSTPLGSITDDEFVKMCLYIGSLTITDDASTVIAGYVGTFSPPTRYGQLIVFNNSNSTLVADGVEHHVVFDPIVIESQ